MESIYLYLSWALLRRLMWGRAETVELWNCALLCLFVRVFVFVCVCVGLLLGENQLCIFYILPVTTNVNRCCISWDFIMYLYRTICIWDHLLCSCLCSCVFAHFVWYPMWKCIIECRLFFITRWTILKSSPAYLFSTPTSNGGFLYSHFRWGASKNSMAKFLIKLYLFISQSRASFQPIINFTVKFQFDSAMLMVAHYLLWGEQKKQYWKIARER